MDDRSGLCLGCGRTLHEIDNWVRYTNAERREITRALRQRLLTLSREADDESKP